MSRGMAVGEPILTKEVARFGEALNLDEDALKRYLYNEFGRMFGPVKVRSRNDTNPCTRWEDYVKEFYGRSELVMGQTGGWGALEVELWQQISEEGMRGLDDSTPCVVLLEPAGPTWLEHLQSCCRREANPSIKELQGSGERILKATLIPPWTFIETAFPSGPVLDSPEIAK
jgi:hypothetical protein